MTDIQMDECVEMQIKDDPIDCTRVYLFKVRISRMRLLNKYKAVWCIVKYLWKVVRHGERKKAD